MEGTNSVVASTQEIRSHFPALRRLVNGRQVAYFDGPGGTQVPEPVVAAMSDYLFNHNANTHWAYPTSHETDEIIDASRKTVADFLNCERDEIVFGQNMTTLTFHLARTLGRDMSPGDEIVVTELDHHANVDTWRSLETERGVIVKSIPLDTTTGQLRLETLEHLLSDRTRLLAIGAASNILGTINDFAGAVDLAKRAGVLTFVDAVHYAAHELVDVRRLECDFLACSAYKFYGPHIGILYGRRELLDRLDFPKLRPAPDYSPERAETGTNNHEGIAGAAAAVEYLASLTPSNGTRRDRLRTVFAELHRRQTVLTRQLWEGLASIPGVTVYGPPPGTPRTPTISFSVAGRSSTDVARQLAGRAVFVSDGNFYALRTVELLELDGTVRAGCACYTTAEEVERLIEGVRETAG